MGALDSRDGLLQVVDVMPQGDGSARVTVVEMIGERGYIKRRVETVRRLARRATRLNGRTRADGEHFCSGQGRMTVQVWPTGEGE
ncbi:hypothetical protein EDD28_0051 [Salana multivorans]|uniref:Uncharacterized protein n=1 Tax=Salana multivorans TaxID=120377 RepID=A0A3N2D768_9MICO|nr:hypothetical protein [Salana multivorans]ROR95498.1 hypothetical protein EDD28_0051 [Salana multivorans]